MIDSFKLWLQHPAVWLNLALLPVVGWTLGKLFKTSRRRLAAPGAKFGEQHRRKVEAHATDAVLTYKIVASREAWLTMFILGSALWFGFVTLGPFRVFLEMGVAATALVFSPVWLLEILFLSRDSLLRDILAHREALRVPGR